MKTKMKFLLILFIFYISFTASSQIKWNQLEKGLEYSLIPLPIKSIVGDSKVDVLRIDPSYFKFQLISAAEKKTKSKPAPDWAKEYNVIALLNAGMFKLDGDFQTCTGYMKNKKYINNPTLNPSYKNCIAFNCKDSTLPSCQIIDMTCQTFEKLKNSYQTLVQGIRMIGCNGENTWAINQKKWSMVLMGQDKSGKIMFIFVRSPYKVNNFISILLNLELSLNRLIYLEGGPEASFFINHPKLQIKKMGSYETGFNENDSNNYFWSIPNCIAITRLRDN